ncbi:MAG TPA: hypothetical protein VEV82_04660 [Actinomycetota bacterium]|nr:hypothetical protein [Actinomycetota bacterium]
MIRGTSRLVAAGAALSLLTGAAASLAAPTPTKRARTAVSYIVSQQENNGSIPSFSVIGSTADGIVSMVAARRAPAAIARAGRYLENHEADVDRVGEKAKVILALEAAGRDPRSFAGHNLVKDVRDGFIDGRYGDLSQSYVFDQALAILALSAAGAEIEAEALNWLLDAQCDDGGWQFDLPSSKTDDAHCSDSSVPPPGDFSTSDTNTTSYAIQAIRASGFLVVIPEDAYDFLETARDPIKKGWVFAPQFACSGGQEPPNCSVSDANSTALVIQARVAVNKPVSAGARGALRSLQYRLCGPNAGAFAVTWNDDDGELNKSGPDIGATVGAIPGVLDKPFPIPAFDVTKPAPSTGPC